MQELYRALFDKVPDFSGISLPTANGVSPLRTIFVAQEIVKWTDGKPLEGTLMALLRLCSSDVSMRDATYGLRLDEVLVRNERSPEGGSYIFSVHDVREARDDAGNFLNTWLKPNQSRGQTFLERVLHEASYYLERSEHLDERTWTLCSSSCHNDGSLISVRWVQDKLGYSPVEAKFSLKMPKYLRPRRVYL